MGVGGREIISVNKEEKPKKNRPSKETTIVAFPELCRSTILDHLVRTARSGVEAIDTWRELLHKAQLVEDEPVAGATKLVIVGCYSSHAVFFSRLNSAWPSLLSPSSRRLRTPRWRRRTRQPGAVGFLSRSTSGRRGGAIPRAYSNPATARSRCYGCGGCSGRRRGARASGRCAPISRTRLR